MNGWHKYRFSECCPENMYVMHTLIQLVLNFGMLSHLNRCHKCFCSKILSSMLVLMVYVCSPWSGLHKWAGNGSDSFDGGECKAEKEAAATRGTKLETEMQCGNFLFYNEPWYDRKQIKIACLILNSSWQLRAAATASAQAPTKRGLSRSSTSPF